VYRGERDELLGRRPLGGPQRAVAVGPGQQLVVVTEYVRVQADDEGAPVRVDDNPSLAVEGDDRFADRDPGDPEFRRDLVLRNALARLKVALKDLPADVGGDLLGAGGADQSPRGLVAVPERLGQCKRAPGDLGLLTKACLTPSIRPSDQYLIRNKI